jgi:hypothetical protein
MGFLKGFGTFVLGFLLFLSLSVFSLAFLLNSTLLNPDFVTRQVDRIDIARLVTDSTEENLGQFPEERRFLQVAIKGAIYKVLSDQEPWLKEQVNAAIYSAYDYFLGRSDKLNIIISREPFRESLGDNLKQTIIQSLPSEAAGLTPAQIEQYIYPYYQEFARDVSSDISFDESLLNTPESINQIAEVRQYIGYFKTGYIALIGFMVVLVAGIFLIYRNVPEPSRALGIDLSIFGVLDMAGVFMARSFHPLELLPDIPPSLETWFTGLYNDVTGIMLTFSIVVLAIGVALIVISFVFKKRVAEG